MTISYNIGYYKSFLDVFYLKLYDSIFNLIFQLKKINTLIFLSILNININQFSAESANDFFSPFF